MKRNGFSQTLVPCSYLVASRRTVTVLLWMERASCLSTLHYYLVALWRTGKCILFSFFSFLFSAATPLCCCCPLDERPSSRGCWTQIRLLMRPAEQGDLLLSPCVLFRKLFFFKIFWADRMLGASVNTENFKNVDAAWGWWTRSACN